MNSDSFTLTNERLYIEHGAGIHKVGTLGGDTSVFILPEKNWLTNFCIIKHKNIIELFMPKVTIYHFPNWGSSKNALAVAEELGVDHEVVLYIKTPPDRKALESIIHGLEDPVDDLVRKDTKIKKLERKPEDYVDNPEAVIEILVKHKQLLQRPINVKGKKAIIGRPKDRIKDLLS